MDLYRITHPLRLAKGSHQPRESNDRGIRFNTLSPGIWWRWPLESSGRSSQCSSQIPAWSEASAVFADGAGGTGRPPIQPTVGQLDPFRVDVAGIDRRHHHIVGRDVSNQLIPADATYISSAG